ncbi:hypothetical protein FXN63_24970 [Pigmentiphaga aceris]|uniref:Uncharacterized protein n=1 Tax=Pigmentiphaga aceris TaxID=1940612 RepID=A0A5C0B473_9BURK|nr:hypothetical protein [Pigmentiphaga aceris]QEI08734.1 hypothetical protein FXN63_24970 [Pigmentiphaga aceris]
MATVTVEKFVGGKQETQFCFPAVFLGMARVMLPRAALTALAEKGMDVAGMLSAMRSGRQYTTSVNLVEKGVSKTVVVSVV